jgi:hypothetical protein
MAMLDPMNLETAKTGIPARSALIKARQTSSMAFYGSAKPWVRPPFVARTDDGDGGARGAVCNRENEAQRMAAKVASPANRQDQRSPENPW